MSEIRFIGLSNEVATHYRQGGLDAHGLVPERKISDGGAPCRVCLRDIEAGEAMLVLAHCPFPTRQAYAEVGPIFIHHHACAVYGEKGEVPPIFLARKEVVMRGYDRDHFMLYETAQRIATSEILATASELLGRENVAYLHLRGTHTTCFQCQIQRMS